MALGGVPMGINHEALKNTLNFFLFFFDNTISEAIFWRSGHPCVHKAPVTK